MHRSHGVVRWSRIPEPARVLDGDDPDAERPSGEYRLDVRSRDRHRLRHTDVGEVMSRTVYGVAPEWSVDEVRRITRWCGIRHVLVVPSPRLLSVTKTPPPGTGTMLRHSDVLGIVARHDLDAVHGETQVSECMTHPVATVGIAVSLEHAAHVMRTRGIGALPVLDEGRIAGIVSREDLRRAGVPEGDLAKASCLSCGGRRQLQIDYRRRGLTLCVECAERAAESLPFAEMGVGD